MEMQVWKMLIICMQVWQQTGIVWLESPDSVKLVFTGLDWAGISELTGGAGLTVTSWLLWRSSRTLIDARRQLDSQVQGRIQGLR